MNSNVLKSNMILKIALSVAVILSFMFPLEAISSCGSPANPIEAENCLTGNPSSRMGYYRRRRCQLSRALPPTSASTKGRLFSFKIDDGRERYHLDIYRIGYYNGDGARKVPQRYYRPPHLPQTQPACTDDYDNTNLQIVETGPNQHHGQSPQALYQVSISRSSCAPIPGERAISFSLSGMTRAIPTSFSKPLIPPGRPIIPTASAILNTLTTVIPIPKSHQGQL